MGRNKEPRRHTSRFGLRPSHGHVPFVPCRQEHRLRLCVAIGNLERSDCLLRLRDITCRFRCRKTLHLRLAIEKLLAIEVAIYRMGNWPGAKIPEKWERKWKMAPRLKWPENGRQNGKNGENQAKIPFSGPFYRFDGLVLAISGLGPFSIFFPIFPGPLLRASFPFCTWPLQSQR